MPIYYIDGKSGKSTNDGLTPQTPLDSSDNISIIPGDTILFKRGTEYNSQLRLINGDIGCPVTYSAYGDGDMPKFYLSKDVSDVNDWVRSDRENVWECTVPIDGEVGNFVFNGDECTATLRWCENELDSQGDFYDSRFGTNESKKPDVPKQKVLLYSKANPALFYDKIECISYSKRVIGRLCHNIVIDGLKFANSGVHALAGSGDNITVRNCVFENIGGCAWNSDLKIRFGNAFEIWYSGNNILIEGCTFKNVYDSCITHQGPGEQTRQCNTFICRDNIFDTYGMAAFEYRDKLPINSSFTNNTCKNAGCGFAMLGEDLPRSSEIWPQPMGHHIFLWRIPKAEAGDLLISDNLFGSAPVGAAIYSIISKEAEDRITLKNNRYTKNDSLLIHFGGESFTDLEKYKKVTGKDSDSTYTN